MIISASRRTDIPAFYTDEFVDNFKNSKPFIVKNNKIVANKDNTECIVFWTKNPNPIMNRLKEIEVPFYFQFTLNPYDKTIEPNVPSKGKVMIRTMNKLADLIGSNKVIWRYDPIIISNKYSLEYHYKYFEEIMKRVHKSCRSCTFSFVDVYGKVANKLSNIGRAPSIYEQREIAKKFSEIAKVYNVKLQTCAEVIDLEKYGITHGACIDSEIISEITGRQYLYQKDISQRPSCRCIPSVDIGNYYTCKHGCAYCYAC